MQKKANFYNLIYFVWTGGTSKNSLSSSHVLYIIGFTFSNVRTSQMEILETKIHFNPKLVF